ncbi:GTP cyclohydrolase II [Actinopolymorpha sp. NPDC004070]|uniref:GTP cyclohydrolase II n=1 Tax=Actinopolymorpha sp. NPDC004070 TaxID=3154548 RepID=UPI0033BD37E0
MTAQRMPAAGSPAAGPVERAASTRLPTEYGDFTAYGYRTARGVDHLALVRGDVADGTETLVRLHSECLTGDVLGSLRCDCGPQLRLALAAIAAADRGVIVYLRGHEGRGIGLAAKLAAYALQDDGHDTVDANLALGLPADARDYADAAAILADLGVVDVRLLSNNPAKAAGLCEGGIRVVGREPLVVAANPENAGYLATKRDRFGHILPTG